MNAAPPSAAESGVVMGVSCGGALRRFRDLLVEEQGVTGTEYALVAWLIAIALIVALLFAGGSVATLWTNLGNCVASFGTSCSL